MTSNQDKKMFAQAMAVIGEMRGISPSKDLMKIYFKALEPLGIPNVIIALGKLSEESTSKIMPSIGDIKRMAIGKLGPREEATELAGKIMYAMSRMGRYQSENARNHVGELGWQAVERMGGWALLCDTQQADLGTIMAHCRNGAEVLEKKQNAGQEIAMLGSGHPTLALESRQTARLADRFGQNEKQIPKGPLSKSEAAAALKTVFEKRANTPEAPTGREPQPVVGQHGDTHKRVG